MSENNDKIKKRIGVYICHCGGNISDYVDVEQLKEMMEQEGNVAVSKNVMFACADSNQKEMIRDIQEKNLDGIVVASCSPKLHLHTFRNVALRAGLNPYNYVQVNVREQCSWAHSDHPEQATFKAAGLIQAGIKRVSHSEALENIRIKTTKAVLIIGAGVSGLRAALDLSRMGNQVYLVEKENMPGGQLRDRAAVFPTGQRGQSLIDTLVQQVRKQPNIMLFTSAEVEKVSGSLGNFTATLHVNRTLPDTMNVKVGAIMVTTGYEPYRPEQGEYGYGNSNRVMTLPEFERLLQNQANGLSLDNKPIKTVAYIYCVGMRQTKGKNKYCSRVCCTSAIHNSLELHKKYPGVRAFHFYRDIRTYGKQEMLYEQSSKNGDVYLMFTEKDTPVVEVARDNVVVRTRDQLTRKRELELEADIVVLVTGMVPRSDSKVISEKLKIPVGSDSFFNEIHPKLRPVETVINGVFLGGSCQGPRNISESVQSSLSAAAKINAIIRKDVIELEPIIARINPEACIWCDKCRSVCEYDAIFQVETNGKLVAAVNESTCKGCGMCAPVCPPDAIELVRYTDLEIEGMIDGFMTDAEIKAREKGQQETEEKREGGMKDLPQLWRDILGSLNEEPRTIPQIADGLGLDPALLTWHVMTMNKYYILEPAGIDDNDEYYYYSPKNRIK